MLKEIQKPCNLQHCGLLKGEQSFEEIKINLLALKGTYLLSIMVNLRCDWPVDYPKIAWEQKINKVSNRASSRRYFRFKGFLFRFKPKITGEAAIYKTGLTFWSTIF
jgi:hypothetical protein